MIAIGTNSAVYGGVVPEWARGACRTGPRGTADAVAALLGITQDASCMTAAVASRGACERTIRIGVVPSGTACAVIGAVEVRRTTGATWSAPLMTAVAFAT